MVGCVLHSILKARVYTVILSSDFTTFDLSYSKCHHKMNPIETTTPTPPPPAPLVEETAVSQPAEGLSPGWSTEVQQAVHPSGDTSSAGPASLAALIAVLQADRESRQEESARSKERMDRLEEWLRKLGGGISEGGRTGEVPDATMMIS